MVSICRHARHRRTYLAGGGLVLAAIWLAGASPQPASSNPPQVSIGIVQKPPQAQTQTDAGKATDSQHDAKNNLAIGKSVAPSQSQPEASKAADQKDNKSSADWWLVKLTGGLILVGLIQSLVFWVQAGRLKETVDTMKLIDAGQSQKVEKSIAEAARAAEAMERLATATAISAAESGKLADAAVNQANTIRESFDASNRPWLVVIPVPFVEGEAITDDYNVPKFRFDVVNYGNGPAIIDTYFKEIIILNHMIDESEFIYKFTEKFVESVVPPTKSVRFTAVSDGVETVDSEAIFFAIGEILYESVNGLSCSTRFCWKYRAHERQFYEAKHSPNLNRRT